MQHAKMIKTTSGERQARSLEQAAAIYEFHVARLAAKGNPAQGEPDAPASPQA